MKDIFRNFLHILSRFKTASTLNLLGLSVAFTAFLVVMTYVRFEYGFDHHISML